MKHAIQWAWGKVAHPKIVEVAAPGEVTSWSPSTGKQVPNA